MAGTLYVVKQAGYRLVFDPDGSSFKAVPAPTEGQSTIVVKRKPKRVPKPEPKPIETKGTLPPEPNETRGTLPPKPIDIDMSFVGGLPDQLKADGLWHATGATAPGISAIKGAVTLKFLQTSTQIIPEGEYRVLVLEPDDGG